MCRVLGVSTSGYYAWRGRGPSERASTDAALMERIRTIHARSRGTYGVPRVHAELAAEGVLVGRKRVARLMREAGIQGISRRRRRCCTKRDEGESPTPDLVNRNFTADGPDRLWVADITYGVPSSRCHQRDLSMSGIHLENGKEVLKSNDCSALRQSESRSGGDLLYTGRVT